MYGIYGEVIAAAERATAALPEKEELLEYPEVQADKAYYLSVLSEYNRLKSVKDKLLSLKKALEEEGALNALLIEASEGERGAIYEEISLLKRSASRLASSLSDEIGGTHVRDRAYVRAKMGALSSKIGVPFFAQIKAYLLAQGAKIEEEEEGKTTLAFFAEGEDIITRLTPLAGAHKVCLGGRSEELCLAVTPATALPELMEKDLKIDVFHSSGAGGQNVNKVETAVRVIHLPTGTVVTCQDERSQLQNRKKALARLQSKLREGHLQAEKKRMEADIGAQFRQKNGPLSFDAAASTVTDTRLKWVTALPFPFPDFSAYVNGLLSL